MNKSHWTEFHRRWSQFTPPLRPNKEVAEAFGQIVDRHSERILLLGVTPELANIGVETIGVDQSEMMIANIWPGDTARRHAVNANWLDLPFANAQFSAAIGDGSLNAITYPGPYRRLYDQLSKVLRPGSRFAFRLFKAPDRGEPLAAVRGSALSGKIRSFHAFKWRLAMAIVAEARDPNIKVARIRDVFDGEFPDRAALAKAAGWRPEDIDTIDIYRGSSEIYSFPTYEQLLAAAPDSFTQPRLVPVGSYELAERCPLVVMDLKP